MGIKLLGGALLCVSLIACGDDGGGGGGSTDARTPDGSGGGGSDSGGGGGNLVDGMIVPVGGGTAPAMGNTIVAWSSDIGQGDFLYKYGEGTATATTFTANVTPPVPDDATFGGILGVGVVVLVPSSTTVADGPIANNFLTMTALGYTGEYAIIYRPNNNPLPEASWVNDFPVGLACGRCVHQTMGFDTFEPVSCSEMKLQVGPLQSVIGCNWT